MSIRVVRAVVVDDERVQGFDRLVVDVERKDGRGPAAPHSERESDGWWELSLREDLGRPFGFTVPTILLRARTPTEEIEQYALAICEHVRSILSIEKERGERVLAFHTWARENGWNG